MTLIPLIQGFGILLSLDKFGGFGESKARRARSDAPYLIVGLFLSQACLE
jgi:hypothetical protein